MLAARVPAGVVENGQVDQGVDHDFAADGLVQRLLKVDALDRVAPVGDHDQRLASGPAPEHLRGEVDRVVKCRRRPVIEIVETRLQDDAGRK